MSPKQNEVLEYLSKVKEAGPAEIIFTEVENWD